MNLKKLCSVICSLVLVGPLVHAQIDHNQLDSLRNAFASYRNEALEDWDEYKAQAFQEYSDYLAIATSELHIYNESIRQTWGSSDTSSLNDTPTIWVEYSKDMSDRSIVDFEKGTVSIEVAIPRSLMSDRNAVNEHLARAIERTLNSRGNTCPYSSSVDASEPLTAEPILSGLISLEGYDIDTSSVTSSASERKAPPSPTVKSQTLNIPQNSKPQKVQRPKTDMSMLRDRQERENTAIAQAVADQSEKEIVPIKGDDGQERYVVQVTLPLVSDNINKNAALYKDLVAEFSEIFQIEQPLIYAVMEQESSFNPQAKSWVPAYGLMQLVATSGGYDAYRFVYNIDWVPTSSYLYNPRNNIELGTAYLRILMNQFSKVQDEDCRRLCVIASYNTGAGNVSRAFTGKTNVSKAMSLINEYDYTGLYNHLTRNLNSDEARNYVSGVSRRREKYLK